MYSTTIFEQTGMADPKLGTVILGMILIVFCFSTVALIDKFGRKKLLIGSLGFG